jgi:ribose 5-phosphate isomerase A
MTAAEKALEYIEDDMLIGLGTGRAATAFIHALGERAKRGLKVRGVPTSQVSADLATQLGIPLLPLDARRVLDITFDGADEVDPNLDLIKGYGGALVREKIVAASSKRLIILVGAEKLVPALGAHGKLPVEVVPFGQPLCERRLAELGCRPQVRAAGDVIFVTDNGNHILDVGDLRIVDPGKLETELNQIPGIVTVGLFAHRGADVLLVGDDEGVETLVP